MGSPGASGSGVVELIKGLRAGRVRANLERVRGRDRRRTGRDPERSGDSRGGQVRPGGGARCARRGGDGALGENRAQDLADKADAHPGRFTWDFIGHLQSRKVRQILPYVRYIHSVCQRLGADPARPSRGPATEVLVEVNVARRGRARAASRRPTWRPFLERCPVPVVGLMTMPPLARDPEDSRRHFAALRELAQQHGLQHLSMGTSQDYFVAVQEGATIVRLGTSLYSQV